MLNAIRGSQGLGNEEVFEKQIPFGNLGRGSRKLVLVTLNSYPPLISTPVASAPTSRNTPGTEATPQDLYFPS